MSAILAALALSRTVAYDPTFNAPRSIRRTCAFSVTTFILRPDTKPVPQRDG
jgi:hypothetical protein